MSKKPALGAQWFAEKAALNRQYGVLPSSFEYLPPGGKPGKKYLMTGATRRDYLNLITLDISDRPRMSEWVRATFDKLERNEFVDSCDSGSFNDEAFLARQMALHKQQGLIVWQEGLAKLASEAFTVDLARDWGFEDVEGFEAFVAAGGTSTRPEYFRGGSFHVSGGASPETDRAAYQARVQRAAKRAPTGFDRQGKPYWGELGRDYLSTAFARPGAGAEAGSPSEDE